MPQAAASHGFTPSSVQRFFVEAGVSAVLCKRLIGQGAGPVGFDCLSLSGVPGRPMGIMPSAAVSHAQTVAFLMWERHRDAALFDGGVPTADGLAGAAIRTGGHILSVAGLRLGWNEVVACHAAARVGLATAAEAAAILARSPGADERAADFAAYRRAFEASRAH